MRLWTKLDLVCYVDPSKTEDTREIDVEPQAAYAHSLLRTIADTLAAKVEAGHPDIPKYIDRLVPHLYQLFIYSATQNARVATDPRLIAVAAKIVTLIVQTLPSE